MQQISIWTHVSYFTALLAWKVFINVWNRQLVQKGLIFTNINEQTCIVKHNQLINPPRGLKLTELILNSGEWTYLIFQLVVNFPPRQGEDL